MMVAPGIRLEVPVDPDPDQARQWAIEELSKQPYQAAKPGLLEQLWQSVLDFFNRLVAGLQNFTGADGSVIGTILVVGLVLLVAGVIFLLRPRLLHRRRPDAEVFDAEASLSAEEHRRQAEKSAATGDFDAAVAELFRALVRSAEERVVIDAQPGRTADEVASRLSTAFGTEAARLRRAALLFNRIRYGVHQPGTALASGADYRWLQELDRALQELQPEHSDARLAWVAPQ